MNPWVADWQGRDHYWEKHNGLLLLRYKNRKTWRKDHICTENRWFTFEDGQAILGCGQSRIGRPIQIIPVLSQTIFTASAGTNTTATSDPSWNNLYNWVEVLGGGASGNSGSTSVRAGGGAGAYTRIYNFVFATPGTTTAVLRPGVGGTAVTGTANSTNGEQSWFNNTIYPTSGTGAGADKGLGASSGTGGAGGLSSNAYASPSAYAVKVGGGNGFGGSAPWGGGGAGGPNGAGGNADTTFSGSADGGTVAGRSTAGTGASGTEFDGSHGCGAGGISSASVQGFGGNYGGAGGGSPAANASGPGAQGIVVLNWGPGQKLYEKMQANKRSRFW